MMSYISSYYLAEEYKFLENCLVTYFYDPCGKTDEEIIQLVISSHDKKALSDILKEGRKFLLDKDFDSKILSNASNRFFIDEDNARNWLEMVLSTIEENLPHDDENSLMH